MLVACISYNDLTIPHGSNHLLEHYCNDFMQKLGAALPELLKPPVPASQTSGGSKPAGGSTAAAEDLQQVLRHDGDYPGPIDGIYGPETKASSQKYLTKHPSGPT